MLRIICLEATQTAAKNDNDDNTIFRRQYFSVDGLGI